MARTRLVVSFSLCLSMVGYGITVPVMPFLARDFGAGPLEVSLLVSLFALAQFVSAPFWGNLSDRYGRRPILLAGLGGYALSFFLAGLSKSVPALVGSRALGGLLAGCIFPTSQALMADVTGEADRGPAMAALGAWTNLGNLLGPVIGGVLAPLGYAPPLFIAGGVVLVTAVAAAWEFLGPGTRPKAGKPASAASPLPAASWLSAASSLPAAGPRRPTWPRLRDISAALRSPISPYLSLTFAVSFSAASLTALAAYFIMDRYGGTATATGAVFSAQGLVALAVQALLLGRLLRRYRERRVALAGTAIAAAGFVGMVAAPDFGWMMAAGLVVGLGASLLRPSLTSAVSLESPLPQGLSLGVQSSFDSLGRMTGPTIGGWLYGFGPAIPFWCAALVMASVGAAAAAATQGKARAARQSSPRAPAG